MMRRLIAAGSVALLAGATGAGADPIPAEDFSKAPSVSSVSMSLEGDMLVGVIADPTQGGDMRAAAYWDLTGNIDPSKPLLRWQELVCFQGQVSPSATNRDPKAMAPTLLATHEETPHVYRAFRKHAPKLQ